ncbi:MAG TPA: hypothetical protein VIG07_09070 [Methylomirabilota bacterium]|jgi:hypothetical protein
MCFACKSDGRCEHALKDCSAVKGDYCPVCHHGSSLATPARRSTPSGPKKDRRGLSALLREIRQRRGRRAPSK